MGQPGYFQPQAVRLFVLGRHLLSAMMRKS